MKAPNIGDWTPCRERMPEDGEFVFVTGVGIKRHVDGPEIDVALWQDDAWWFGGGTEPPLNEVVTHWMELPKLPNADLSGRTEPGQR